MKRPIKVQRNLFHMSMSQFHLQIIPWTSSDATEDTTRNMNISWLQLCYSNDLTIGLLTKRKICSKHMKSTRLWIESMSISETWLMIPNENKVNSEGNWNSEESWNSNNLESTRSHQTTKLKKSTASKSKKGPSYFTPEKKLSPNSKKLNLEILMM